MNYQNDVLENIIQDFETTMNYSERIELFSQSQDILYEDLPAIPIVFGASPLTIKKEMVLPNATYFDQGIYSWEHVRKEEWTEPLGSTQRNNNDTNIQITVLIATAVVIGIAYAILKRR